jgi:hypothetical protein
VRELNGDVYFGEKGMRKLEDGRRQGWDMMSYAEDEVRRIAHAGFKAAQGRKGKLCSVDKANVLETSQLWRDVVIEVSAEYPDVELSHMYVDNAAMQLVKSPGQFDVIVTGNLFGDILSDQASMCVGSIGLLASASLGTRQTEYGTVGLYEPIHGSAPTLRARTRPTRWRRSCRRPCCCATRWGWRRKLRGLKRRWPRRWPTAFAAAIWAATHRPARLVMRFSRGFKFDNCALAMF